MITVKFTEGFTVTFVVFELFVPPSVEFTTATFENVPFTVVFTCTHTRTVWCGPKVEMFHLTTPLSNIPWSVALLPDLMYTKPAGRVSVIHTLFAVDSPEL